MKKDVVTLALECLDLSVRRLSVVVTIGTVLERVLAVKTMISDAAWLPVTLGLPAMVMLLVFTTNPSRIRRITQQEVHDGRTKEGTK
jgi:hypothetical protein